MLQTSWSRTFAVIACAMLITSSQSSYGALLLNYQFESVSGTAGLDQTTPDSSGNFTSTPGTINAVLGHGTQTPGTDFPNLIAGPVQTSSGSLKSRNKNSAMNFPGNPAIGNITTSIERVEIADLSSGALDATFSNFSVALWLNPSSTDRDRFAIGKIGGSGQRGWQIYSPPGTTDIVIDYFASAANLTDRSLKIAGALPLNTWTHVILAFDGINQTEAVYLNNVLQTPDSSLSSLGAVPTTLNGANNQPFRVGHRGATGNTVGSWAGGIDDVMIFNETLVHTRAGSATGTGSTLVPEPSAFLTFVIGMIGLTFAYRRKNL